MKLIKLNILLLLLISVFNCHLTYGMCKLKNGKICPKPIVLTTTLLLRIAFSENFVAFFDLIEKCKNPNYSYPPCGPGMGGKFSIKYLNKMGLVDEDGNIQHASTRDIILSSAEGDGFALRYVNPVTEDFTEKKDPTPTACGMDKTTEPGCVDISDLDKVEILRALYVKAQPQGMGFLHFIPEDTLSYPEAKEILENQRDYVDYLKGGVMKVDLSGKILRTRMFNRDNGENAAERVIEQLRSSKK